MEPQVPAFRPGKKRKIYRHRTEDTDESPLDAPLATPQPTFTPDPRPSDDSTDTANTDEQLPVSSLLRLRQVRKGRLGGVAFRAGSTTQANEQPQNTEQSLVPHDGGAENPVIGGITTRFAPQTGLVGELVNKHM